MRDSCAPYFLKSTRQLRVTRQKQFAENRVGYPRIPGTNFFPIRVILIHKLTLTSTL